MADKSSNGAGLPKAASKYSVDTTTDSNANLANNDVQGGEAGQEDRGQWGSKAEFILSCVGLSVGLGNIWRFPFLAYELGGGAFVIPYIILLILAGKPMYFMELMLGQYSSLGPTAVWRCVPLGRGIGLAMCCVSLIVAIYYNVIMAYTLYYFFGSMQSTMPWTTCSSLDNVYYQNNLTNSALPVYQWKNGSDDLYRGPGEDPIRCLELSSDKKVVNFAFVKQNRYKQRLRTILQEEEAWLKNTSKTVSQSTSLEDAQKMREDFKKYLEERMEGEDEAKKKSATAVSNELAKILYCGDPDYSCNLNTTCQWEKCRCSGNSTADTDCQCDSGLTVCPKINGIADSTNQEIFDTKSSTELYFTYVVLEQSKEFNFGNLGTPRWKVVLCLLLSWIVVFVCLFKGVKSSGKVVYFTATFPYIVLIILMIKGCTMTGAVDGIIFFLKPTWEKMSQVVTWRKAAGQMFFSLSVSWGGLIMFGSYNKFRNGVYGDAMFVSVCDTVTSILGGITIFSILGNMAHELDTKVDEVAGSGGFGLAFMVYPQALASLPIPQFWTIIFFFMLFTLGLDSEFALLETVITGFSDEWPRIFRDHKAWMCGALSVSCFLLALPCTCQAGSLVTDMLDTYGGGFVVLFIAFTECMALMWVYGFWNFSKDCKLMLGFEPNWYWLFTWAIASPILLLFLFIYSLADYTPMDSIPVWGDGIGWIFAAIIMLTIVFYPVITLVSSMTGKNKLSFKAAAWRLIRPESSWGPADKSLQFQRYNDPQYTQHWSWLPACIKDKEREFLEEFKMEVNETGANVNRGFQQGNEL